MVEQRRMVMSPEQLAAIQPQEHYSPEQIKQWFATMEQMGRHYGQCLEDLNRRLIALERKAQP